MGGRAAVQALLKGMPRIRSRGGGQFLKYLAEIMVLKKLAHKILEIKSLL